MNATREAAPEARTDADREAATELALEALGVSYRIP